LKDALNNIFVKSKVKSLPIDLTGVFITDYEFEIKPQTIIGTFPMSIGNPPILKGVIHKTKNNLTQIDLLVIPHSIYSMAFFLLPISFIVVLIEGFKEDRLKSFDIILVIAIIIAIPIVILFLSNLSKRRLQTRFVTYFKLTKLD